MIFRKAGALFPLFALFLMINPVPAFAAGLPTSSPVISPPPVSAPAAAVSGEPNTKKTILLSINGVKNDPEIQILAKNQTNYVNLAFFTKYLHAAVNWEPDKGGLTIVFGALKITLVKDKTDYLVNDSPRSLSVPPIVENGQPWLPVEFVCRLGLTVQKSDSATLALNWSGRYLLPLEIVMYQSRPAFMLTGTNGFQINSFLLTKPDRLAVDLKGVKTHFAFDTNLTGNPLVKSVRFYQQTADSIRLVFDLNRAVGYQLIRPPGKANQAIILFNYAVEDIRFSQKDQEHKLYIQTSFPAQYKATRLTRPDRMVIDLDGATLTRGNQPISGDGNWIKVVRINQFNGQTVRIVLDLVPNALCFIRPARDNPNLIEVRAAQTVRKITWTESDPNHGYLTITADGELEEKVETLKNPDKLRVDLAYTRLDPSLSALQIRNRLVQGLRWSLQGEAMLRLEVDLSHFVNCRTEFSPDRRQMIIHLANSPLAGKVVVVDPGHGGVDPGATGGQGTVEKAVNLQVAMGLKCLLEDSGANVVLTRIDDTYISLYERPFVANYLFADLFISIHSNMHPNLAVQGTEVYYYPAHSGDKVLARCIADRMHEMTGLAELGVKTNNFVVIRESQMPGILVELGFLSNPQEEKTMDTPEFKDAAARGIFQGIMDYYQK